MEDHLTPEGSLETSVPKKLGTAKKISIGLIPVAFVGFFIYIGLVSNANDDAWNGERVIHASCTITDKRTEVLQWGSAYFIDSTCGNFPTNDKVWDGVEEGKMYDLKTTKGNWAHQSYLLKADLKSENTVTK